MGRKVSWGTTTGESTVSVGRRGPEIFDQIEISSGPSNGIREKILLYTHTRRTKIRLRSRSTKLLHTRRERSRVSGVKTVLLEVQVAGSSILLTIWTSRTDRQTMRSRFVPFPARLQRLSVLHNYFRSENVVTKSTSNASRDIFMI